MGRRPSRCSRQIGSISGEPAHPIIWAKGPGRYGPLLEVSPRGEAGSGRTAGFPISVAFRPLSAVGPVKALFGPCSGDLDGWRGSGDGIGLGLGLGPFAFPAALRPRARRARGGSAARGGGDARRFLGWAGLDRAHDGAEGRPIGAARAGEKSPGPARAPRRVCRLPRGPRPRGGGSPAREKRAARGGTASAGTRIVGALASLHTGPGGRRRRQFLPTPAGGWHGGPVATVRSARAARPRSSVRGAARPAAGWTFASRPQRRRRDVRPAVRAIRRRRDVRLRATLGCGCGVRMGVAAFGRRADALIARDSLAIPPSAARLKLVGTRRRRSHEGKSGVPTHPGRALTLLRDRSWPGKGHGGARGRAAFERDGAGVTTALRNGGLGRAGRAATGRRRP